MKTVIFVQNVEFPQQGAIDIFYYAKYLSKYKDIRVKVIISKVNTHIGSENLEIIEIGKNNYMSFIVQAFLAIKKIKKKEKIDYVYFFAQHPFSILLQFFVKYGLGLKTIYDVVSGPIGKGLLPWIAKQTIRLGVFLSDKYVILDKGLINKLHLPHKKQYTTVPMGYDEEIFNPANDKNLFNRKDGEIIFTYIGTLDRTRNLEIFVEMFIENIDINPLLKLYLIGSGNGEELIRGTSKGYLNKKVFLLGKKDHHLIPDYINSSDVLISYIPKIDYFEYQPPTKLIEYLACNKPVIATNTIAQEKILQGYEFLMHKDDKESTKEKIKYLINNLEYIKSHNYIIMVKLYAWGNLIKKLKELL